MIRAILVILLLVISTIAEAACPAGSTCENYNGTIPYAATGGSSTRTPAARAIDRGINILEFGADPTGVADSTTAIQAAIDYAANSQGNRATICPQGVYKTTLPLFLDLPGSMRGSATAWNSGTSYTRGTVVSSSGMEWIALQPLTGVSIVSGGSGYAANDILILAGGTFVTPAIITVNTVSAGAIATFTVSLGGAYSAAPGGNFTVSATSKAGTGATFNTPTWGTNQNQTPKNDLKVNATASYWKFTTATPSSTAFNDSFSFVGAPALAPGSNYTTGCVIEPTFNNAPAFISGPGNGNVVSGLQVQQGTNPIHHCQQPMDGVGIAIPAGSSGASRTLIDDSSAFGYYTGIFVGYGGSALADSNTVRKTMINDACNGVTFGETQAFINDLIEDSIDATTAVRSALDGGANVYGGNHSATVENNIFTITSVSGFVASNTLTVDLTVSNPDSYLQNQLCWANGQCLYNAFVLVSADYGLIPFTLVGAFCASPPTCSTVQLQLQNLATWYAPWGNTLSLSSVLAELTSLTSLYASEQATTFYGHGFNVQGIHVENFMGSTCGATRLINASPDFGSRISHFKNIYFNSDPACSSFSSSASGNNLAASYVQQVFPFMSISADVSIDGMIASQAFDYLMIDLSGGIGSSRLKMSNIPYGEWKFNTRGTVIGGLNSSTFTNDYTGVYTAGLGGGEWDSADVFTSFSASFADQFRGRGWGQAPMWGYQPVPWSSPCITPSQYTTISGSLPAITNSGSGSTMTFAVSYPLVFGGRVYRSCDWNSGTYNNVTSSHQFYSYGQALSSGNIPNFAYSKVNQSPYINLNAEMMNIVFPGLGFQLTCNGVTASKQIITEVHRAAKYITVMDANQNGSPYITNFSKTCTQADSNFLQQAYSFTSH